MQKLIDYLSNSSFDFGNWELSSEYKFDEFSKGDIASTVNVTEQATSYLSGNGVSAGSLVCPPPESVYILGSDVSFSYSPFCDLASLLNPLLLAFTWISAMVLYFRSL
jgi:hypothetical protein